MNYFDEHSTEEDEFNESNDSFEAIENTSSVRSGRRHDDPENNPSKNPFLVPFCLILSYAFIEFFTGFWSQSLALLSDAWHMFSDVFAIGLAMVAFKLTSNQARKNKASSNQNFELKASIINAVLMFVVIGWIISEAWTRFNSPSPVHALPVIGVALIGLLINLYVAKHLHQHDHADGHSHAGEHDHHHLNHQAAFLHVLGDILGSIAALASGIVIYFSGWTVVDPILSLVIAALLLVGTIGLSVKIFKTTRQ